MSRSKPVAYGDLIYLEALLGKQGVTGLGTLDKGLLVADGLISDECNFRSCGEYLHSTSHDEQRHRDRPFSRFPDDIEECLFEVVPQLRYRAHKEHRQEMLKREEQQVHFAKELSDVSSIAGGESKLVFESTIKGLKNDAIYDGSNMNDLKERIKAVVKNELGIQRMNNDDVAVEIEVPIGVVDCSRCMPSSRTHSHQGILCITVAAKLQDAQQAQQEMHKLKRDTENENMRDALVKTVKDTLYGHFDGEHHRDCKDAKCEIEKESIRIIGADDSFGGDDGILSSLSSSLTPELLRKMSTTGVLKDFKNLNAGALSKFAKLKDPSMLKNLNPLELAKVVQNATEGAMNQAKHAMLEVKKFGEQSSDFLKTHVLGMDDETDERDDHKAIANEILRRLHLRMTDEMDQNSAHISAQAGRPVKYGDVIQLRHVRSGKFLKMSKTNSRVDQHGKMIVLDEVTDSPVGGVKSFFKLVSKHKYYSEGENVYPGESISVGSSKLSGYFLSVSPEIIDGTMHHHEVSFMPGMELDAEEDDSTFTYWKLHVFREHHLRMQESLLSGTVIRLQHSLKSGYLTAQEKKELVTDVRSCSTEATEAPSSRGSHGHILSNPGVVAFAEERYSSETPFERSEASLGRGAPPDSLTSFPKREDLVVVSPAWTKKNLKQLVPLPKPPLGDRTVGDAFQRTVPISKMEQERTSAPDARSNQHDRPPTIASRHSFSEHFPQHQQQSTTPRSHPSDEEDDIFEGEQIRPDLIFMAGRAQRYHGNLGHVDEEWSYDNYESPVPVSVLGHNVVVHAPHDHGEKEKVELSKSLWVIEEEDSKHSKPVDPKGKKYRLRHLNTNAYLGTVVSDHKMSGNNHGGKKLFLINMSNQGADTEKFVRCLWYLVPKKVQDSYRPGTFSLHLKLAPSESPNASKEEEEEYLKVPATDGFNVHLDVIVGKECSEDDVFTIEGVDPEYLTRAKAVGTKCQLIQNFIIDLFDTFQSNDLQAMASLKSDEKLPKDLEHLKHFDVLRQTNVIGKWKSHLGRRETRSSQSSHMDWDEHLTKVVELVILSLAQMVLFSNKDDRVRPYTVDEWRFAAKEANETLPSGADTERQKLLGEVGLINLLHDLLALVIAKRKDIAQAQHTHFHSLVKDTVRKEKVEHRLKWVTKLVYKVVRHYCYENEINQMRLAKAGWFESLIIKQLGENVGEEETMMELVNNNIELLEKYILRKDGRRKAGSNGTNTLEQCINIIKQRGLRASRYLAFLKSIASCDKKPVITNQNEIRKRLYMTGRDDIIDEGDKLLRIRFRRAVPTQAELSGPEQKTAQDSISKIQEERVAYIEERFQTGHGGAASFFGRELLDENYKFHNYVVEVSWSMKAFEFPTTKGSTNTEEKNGWMPEKLFENECQYELLVVSGVMTKPKSSFHDRDKVTIVVEKWPLDGMEHSSGNEYPHIPGRHQITIGKECRSIAKSKIMKDTKSGVTEGLEVQITVDIEFVDDYSSALGDTPVAWEITEMEQGRGKVKVHQKQPKRSWVNIAIVSKAAIDKQQEKFRRKTQKEAKLEEDDANYEDQNVHKREHVSLYLLEQIKLIAEICFGRNYASINVLRPEYSMHLLLIVLSENGHDEVDRSSSMRNLLGDGHDRINDNLRAEFANLLRVLWIDVRPQKQLELPFLTVPFGMLSLSSMSDIKTSLSKRSLKVELSSGSGFTNATVPMERQSSVNWNGKSLRGSDVSTHTTSIVMKGRMQKINDFFLLEVIIEDFLKSLSGRQNPFNPPETRLTTALLACVEDLVNFGYFHDEEKVSAMAKTLVAILDGSNDKFRSEKGNTSINRYQKTTTQIVDTVSVMATKQVMCRILMRFDDLALDFQFNAFMRNIDKNLNGVPRDARAMRKGPNVTFDADSREGNNDLTKTEGIAAGEAIELWAKMLEDDARNIEVNTENLRKMNPGLSKHLKELRKILPDLMMYDDPVLQDLAFKLLVRSARRTQKLIETVDMCQVVDKNFSPAICAKWEKERKRDAFPITLDGKDIGAVKSITMIMSVVGDILDELESASIAEDSKVEELISDIFSLCKDGQPNAAAMREMFRDSGLFTMLDRASHLPLFVDHNEETYFSVASFGSVQAPSMRRASSLAHEPSTKSVFGIARHARKIQQNACKKARRTLKALLRLIESCVAGSDINKQATCEMFVTLLNIAGDFWEVTVEDEVSHTFKCGWRFGPGAEDTAATRQMLVEVDDGGMKPVESKDSAHYEALEIVIAIMDVMFEALRGNRELAKQHVTRERIKDLMELAATFAFFMKQKGDYYDLFKQAYSRCIDVIIQAASPFSAGFFLSPVADIQSMVLGKGILGRAGGRLRSLLTCEEEVYSRPQSRTSHHQNRRSRTVLRVGGGGGNQQKKSLLPFTVKIGMEETSLFVRHRILDVLTACCVGSGTSHDLKCRKHFPFEHIVKVVTDRAPDMSEMDASLSSPDTDKKKLVDRYDPWENFDLKKVALNFLLHVHLSTATKGVLNAQKMKEMSRLIKVLCLMLEKAVESLNDNEKKTGDESLFASIGQVQKAWPVPDDIVIEAFTTVLPALVNLQALYGQSTLDGLEEQMKIIENAQKLITHFRQKDISLAAPFDRERLADLNKLFSKGTQAAEVLMHGRSKAPMLREQSSAAGSTAFPANSGGVGPKDRILKDRSAAKEKGDNMSLGDVWDKLGASMHGDSLVVKTFNLVRHDVDSSAMLDFTKALAIALRKKSHVQQKMTDEWNLCCNLLTGNETAGADEVEEPTNTKCKGADNAMKMIQKDDKVNLFIENLLRFIQVRIQDPRGDNVKLCGDALLLLRRMIALRIQDVVQKKDESMKDSRMLHTEATAIAAAEADLKRWQFRVAKLGAPIIISKILCSGEVEVLHASALLLGNRLLDMGNVQVQKLFLQAFTRQPHILASLQKIIRKGLAAAVKSFKNPGGRKQETYHKTAKRDPFTTVLRFVQLLCEGHYKEMQNFLREQPGNEGNMNIVHDLMSYLAQIAKDRRRLMKMNSQTLQQVLNTLSEVMQGPCTGNQDFLLKSDLHEYCANIINLPLEDFAHSDESPPATLRFFMNNETLEQMDPNDIDPHSNVKFVKSKKLDLLACKKAAVITVQALLEGSTSATLARRMRKGLDVQQMVQLLQEAAQTEDNDDDLSALMGSALMSMANKVLDVGKQMKDAVEDVVEDVQDLTETTTRSWMFWRRNNQDSAPAIDQRRNSEEENARNEENDESSLKEALYILQSEVMELVFTMLKGLDEMAPFLKEEITQYESTRSKTSSSVWQFYSKTAGSVEILRGGKVEKYVFRYDPKWQPSVFQKVVRIEDVMSSILSITRLDNPQRRLEELVHTTINMHFEVQHLQSVDNWKHVGPYLKTLRDRRNLIMQISFSLVVILNFVLITAYFYKSEELDIEFPYYGHSGVELMSYNLEHQTIMFIPMLLSCALIPLYLASLVDYMCYKLPVKLHNQYRSKSHGDAQPMLPNLSIFEGRINIGMSSSTQGREAENPFKRENNYSQFVDATEDQKQASRIGMRATVEQYVVDHHPKSGPWIFIILVLTVLEIIMASIREFGIIKTIEYSDLVDTVDLVVISIFLIDLLLRMWSLGRRFFYVVEASHMVGRTVKRFQEFNIVDGIIVVVWATLMLTTKYSAFELSSSVTTPLIWLRVARVIRAVVMILKVVRLILRSGAAAGDAMKSMREKRSSTLAAILLLFYHIITDFRVMIFSLYAITTFFGAVGLVQNVILEEPFSIIFNPLWFSIGLVDMVQRLPTLPNVFNAITIRRRELLQTSALGIYFFYLYGIIVFVFMPTSFMEAHDSPCSTISQCWAYVIEIGLANSDMSAGMKPISWSDPYYLLFWFLTVSYVILISLVLLNVIFGIIIDSFAQLRTEQEEVAKQMINQCFICFKERQVFEDPHIESTFQDHLDLEHNVWNYVCFIVYLASKSKTELTGTEQYVMEELEQNKFSWFPMNRALVTEGTDVFDESAVKSADIQRLIEVIENQRSAAANLNDRGDLEERLESSRQIETLIKLLSEQATPAHFRRESSGLAVTGGPLSTPRNSQGLAPNGVGTPTSANRR